MVAKFGRWLGSPTSIRSAAFADLHTAGSILPSHSSLEILSHKFPDMNRLERPVCRERSKCVIEHCSNIGPFIAGSVSHFQLSLALLTVASNVQIIIVGGRMDLRSSENKCAGVFDFLSDSIVQDLNPSTRIQNCIFSFWRRRKLVLIFDLFMNLTQSSKGTSSLKARQFSCPE